MFMYFSTVVGRASRAHQGSASWQTLGHGWRQRTREQHRHHRVRLVPLRRREPRAVARRSTRSSSTSRRSRASSDELAAAERSAVGRLRRGRRARVRVDAADAERRRRRATCSRHPGGVMSLCFRVQDLDHTMAFLDKRGGTFLADPHRGEGRAGRTLPLRRDRDAARRRRVPLRRAHATSARSRPGFVDSGVGNAGAPENVFGISAIDHVTSNGLTMQPIVALVPRRARLRAVLGDQLPHARRRQGERAQRLGPPVDRDVGPGERREVRDERAAPPVLPRLADHEVRRGQRGQRRAARRVRRDGHPLVGRGARAPRRRVHEDARRRTTATCPARLAEARRSRT